MLNVVMQSVVILNVVAPIQHPVYFEKKILARIIFVKYFVVNTSSLTKIYKYRKIYRIGLVKRILNRLIFMYLTQTTIISKLALVMSMLASLLAK
jgi:hypothetical protein